MGSKENGEERDRDDHSLSSQEDFEPARDSLSSQEDASTKTPKRASRVPKKIPKKEPTIENNSSLFRPTKSSSNRQNTAKLQHKNSNNDSAKKTQKPKRSAGTKHSESKTIDGNSTRASSEVSEEIDERTIELEISIDEPVSHDPGNGTDGEEEESNKSHKFEEMEERIEKLEQELREVAALEISIYSVVPEHGSSAHKVHTPARRLSRLFIHASKYWSASKKATVAKNTISGLVLVAKSCGNDVSRLTYWLSNTVILREIISQTFGNISSQSSPRVVKVLDSGSNGNMKQQNGTPGKQGKNLGIFLPVDDWTETCTFTTALEKIESWIFSRIVESVWWQALTPHMQSPDSSPTKSTVRLSGPVLGDSDQGNFSIELWKSAFRDAFGRLCPLRAGGHECGCLPILAKLVMEQCVARLDTAMFNAILRESESQIPTDPVSDPILDTKVLPISAGDLSFGSGAQLKNSIGNWSRYLSDIFGMDSDDSATEDLELDSKTDIDSDGTLEFSRNKSKTFKLLNELSDLLMLPKDLLPEKSIRKEVCPSIGLSLVIRVLCNFTPDEFCPDPVPGIVLEELSSESMVERFADRGLSSIFPYAASPVIYYPPSPADVAEKAADIGGKSLDKRVSMVQRRGYTSDDDLDDLDSPLSSIIERTPPVTPSSNGGLGGIGLEEGSQGNSRFKLLREVWCE
ncbi:nucleolar-like protein [Rhynchospora pubera]|uniref:Nucleolar-like protein n=1 Tax=Rhynchospora pubera TaxID=906938 RepID=A0AAV8HS79_9POAL|nr:nucleolar-like protein [Rhynchospora pubera]